jgi:hypothetical protein
MADDDKDGVERALARLVGVTEQSGNLRNDLRKDILEAVSTLRNYFVQVQTELEAKTAAHKELERQVRESREEIQRLRGAQSNTMGQVAPSLDEIRQEHRLAQQQLLPPTKLYSEVAKAECMVDKRYKLSVNTKSNHTPEAIKYIIKTSINPTNMKVGICAFRSQRDCRVLLETKSKEEIELLYADIKAKCSQHLDVHIHKLKNPSLIIYNVPEKITKENSDEIIATQNPELNLCEGDVKPKFITKGRRNTRNLVAEVGPLVRRQIFKTKLKIGWHICKAEDYVVVNRCYNCSGYNHKANQC